MKPRLKAEQVCAALQISRATLSRMVAAGEIPYVLRLQGKRKKMVLFDESAIEKWLNMRARGPLSPTRHKSRILMVDEMVTPTKTTSNLSNLNSCDQFEEPVAINMEHAQ